MISLLAVLLSAARATPSVLVIEKGVALKAAMSR